MEGRADQGHCSRIRHLLLVPKLSPPSPGTLWEALWHSSARQLACDAIPLLLHSVWTVINWAKIRVDILSQFPKLNLHKWLKPKATHVLKDWHSLPKGLILWGFSKKTLFPTADEAKIIGNVYSWVTHPLRRFFFSNRISVEISETQTRPTSVGFSQKPVFPIMSFLTSCSQVYS